MRNSAYDMRNSLDSIHSSSDIQYTFRTVQSHSIHPEFWAIVVNLSILQLNNFDNCLGLFGPRLKSVNFCACPRIQGASRKWCHVTGAFTANKLVNTSSNSLRIAAQDKVHALNRACETQSCIPGKARVIHNAALKLGCAC